jgi:hypothetical protein
MARDLGEQEREFVDALAGDTGRDLDGWMLAIAQSGHGARNDIIDWLRQQGFAFSKASWLERIHHNGGRLIYGDLDLRAVDIDRTPAAARAAAKPADVSALPATAAVAELRSGPEIAVEAARLAAMSANSNAAHSGTEEPGPKIDPPVALPARLAASAPAPLPPQAPDSAITPASDTEIAALLVAAKGLRPLAEVILREMDIIVPGLVRAIAPPFLMIASPAPFAALLPAPKDVRLYADFGPKTRDRTRKAEAGRVTPPFPDCLVVNDARQIDERFRELIADAYTRSLK